MQDTTGRAISFAILLTIIPILLGLLCLLQYKLAKKENEAVGLLLPTISFVLSVLILIIFGGLDVSTTDSFARYIANIALYFTLLNIPTGIFYLIFSLCRKKDKEKKELEKMNIMDL